MSQTKNVINGVSIECFDERVMAGKDAKVVIRDPQGHVRATITATIKRQQGADGGWYPAVEFKQNTEAATGGGQ